MHCLESSWTRRRLSSRTRHMALPRRRLCLESCPTRAIRQSILPWTPTLSRASCFVVVLPYHIQHHTPRTTPHSKTHGRTNECGTSMLLSAPLSLAPLCYSLHLNPFFVLSSPRTRVVGAPACAHGVYAARGAHCVHRVRWRCFLKARMLTTRGGTRAYTCQSVIHFLLCASHTHGSTQRQTAGWRESSETWCTRES
jgi:hypothetical protein